MLEVDSAEREYLTYLRSDNSPRFVSTMSLEWASRYGMTNLLIKPDRPWKNGTNESFHVKFKDECLGVNWFHIRKHAKVLIEQCWKYYNTI